MASCGKRFDISGDIVNPAHELFIFDCQDLLRDKRYMQCILLIAQSYEMFFNFSINMELLLKPLAGEERPNFEQFNRLAEDIYKKLEPQNFQSLRMIFLRLIVDGPHPLTLDEAEIEIGKLEVSGKKLIGDKPSERCPSDLLDLVRGFENVTVNQVRNKVIHKRAYRPTREEAEHVVKEAEDLIYGCKSRFQSDDLSRKAHIFAVE
jgi:hypothetical protein